MKGLFPTRWRYDRPPSIQKFMADFADDYACAEYLYLKRWPEGFQCPRCTHQKGWRLESRPWLWECSACGRQTSLIAGTVMHGTRLPLRTWFLGAHLVATHSNGISALQLQPKLGLGSYKTAWLLLHKLRRAMINPDRTPLSGDIEVDETSVPFRKNSDPVDGGQGNSLIGKFKLIGAVELVDKFTPGRIRLERIVQSDSESILPFIKANTAPGCLLITDGNPAYKGIPDRTHRPNNLSKKNALPAHISMKWIHRVFSNFKRWGLGTFHGFRDKHINANANSSDGTADGISRQP